MRKPYSKNFFTTYDKGWRAYVKGNWTDAKEHFE